MRMNYLLFVCLLSYLVTAQMLAMENEEKFDKNKIATECTYKNNLAILTTDGVIYVLNATSHEQKYSSNFGKTLHDGTQAAIMWTGEMSMTVFTTSGYFKHIDLTKEEK